MPCKKISLTSCSRQIACLLPCRTEELAKQSEIKGQAYSPSSVRLLFDGMRAHIERTLLFLKSVRTAAVYVRDAGDETPRLLFRANMETLVTLPHG